jgi:hypothetical protein
MTERAIVVAWLVGCLLCAGAGAAAQDRGVTAQGASALPGTPPRILPRPGNFFPPPSGSGSYSLADHWRGRTRDAAPRSGYPASAIMAPSFFDADFRYLDQMAPEDRAPFERLKRIRLGNATLFSTGGAAWYRFNAEGNSRLTQVDQAYSLLRIRAYGDLWYRDAVRVYGEFLSAGRPGGTLPALPADRNQADLLNVFADVKLFETHGRPAFVRVGRQEVMLGSQRLMSALPWANMRRNFDGVRIFRQGDRFDVDAFWLEPVVPSRTDFDRPTHDVQLIGGWFTYRPRAGHFLDTYYLYSHNDHTVVQQGVTLAPSRISTVGSRYAGDRGRFLWDVEGALQLGSQQDQDVLGGMASLGVGRRFTGSRLSPTVWAYYDVASGDNDPNAGRFTTFNQLYPFGHYYLGWSDIAGRQNIRDANVHVSLSPVAWVSVWLQYHHLWLARAEDALYNAGGAAIRRDPSGNAGTNVGDEATAVVNLHIDAQSDVMVAYAHLFGGRFLEDTAGPAASSTNAFYLIYNVRW